MKRLAQILSVALHPLLMPTYIVFILFNSDVYIGFNPPQQVKLVVYGVMLLNTFILPSALSFYLLKNKVINSFEMADSKERRIPYLITAIFYILTYYLLQKFNLSLLLYVVVLGASAAILIAMIINYKWKISAHMIGIGGVLGVLVGLSLRFYIDFKTMIIISLVLAGMLGSARLFLNAHKPSQVYVGFFVGFFCQLTLFLLL